MANHESRVAQVARAALATPFIGLTIICLSTMDTNKLIAQQQPFLQAGSIDFDNGSKYMAIFENFYGIIFLDEMWRGITVTFSNSYLPLNAIGWWQLFLLFPPRSWSNVQHLAFGNTAALGTSGHPYMRKNRISSAIASNAFLAND